MDDLRTHLRTYFDTAVKTVELTDIVDEADYVFAVAPEVSTRGRRGLDGLRRFAACALLVLLVWGVIALTGGGSQEIGGPPGPVGTTRTTVASTKQKTSIARNADAFDFTYTRPSPGWEFFGGFRLQKSAIGPQGAEGMVYWVTYPNSDFATNCLVGNPGQTRMDIDDLALGVVQTPGLTLVSGPDEVLVGGHRALSSRLEITADEGCDPGYFYNWMAEGVGALWLKYSVGMAVDTWLVEGTEQTGQILVIVGLTDPEFPELRDDIEEFVSSIVFSTE